MRTAGVPHRRTELSVACIRRACAYLLQVREDSAPTGIDDVRRTAPAAHAEHARAEIRALEGIFNDGEHAVVGTSG
jgi:hypothetical protein